MPMDCSVSKILVKVAGRTPDLTYHSISLAPETCQDIKELFLTLTLC